MTKMFPYPVPPSRQAKTETLRVVRSNTLMELRRMVIALMAMQFIQLLYLGLVVIKR
jgi:hypothetical protein